MRNYTDKELEKIANEISTRISREATEYSSDSSGMGYIIDPQKAEKIINECLKGKILTNEDQDVLSSLLKSKTQRKPSLSMTGYALWKILGIFGLLVLIVVIATAF